MKKKGLLFFICILIVIVACVLKYNQFMNAGKTGDEDELAPASSIAISEDEAKKINGMTPVRLYFLNEDSTKLKQEVRYIPDSQATKGNEYLAKVIINELIKGPGASSKLKGLLPKTTKINSVVVEDSKVTVDLDKSFFSTQSNPSNTQKPQVTGTMPPSSNETMALYSIVDSLTNCDGITDVCFSVSSNTDAQELKDIDMQGSLQKKEDIIDKTIK